MTYTPWDMSFIDSAIAYIWNAIGKATNYGILILVIIIAFFLITRIVKIFSNK